MCVECVVWGLLVQSSSCEDVCLQDVYGRQHLDKVQSVSAVPLGALGGRYGLFMVTPLDR